ncbi:MAG: hypothetical protein AAFV93_14900 [Chloroflexota bacterium]
MTKTCESGLIVLNCAHEDGTTLRATFDARNRLTQLQSTLKESDT